MESLTGCDVEILATTGMEKSHVAHLDLDGNSARVLVNLCVCKDLGTVVKALAHETAHIKMRSDVHDKTWERHFKEYTKAITNMYLEAGAEE